MMFQDKLKLILVIQFGFLAVPHWQSELSSSNNQVIAQTRARSLPTKWSGPSDRPVNAQTDCSGLMCREEELKHLETPNTFVNSSQNSLQNLASVQINPSASNFITEPQYQALKLTHCIERPQNMSFCVNLFGWGTKVGLPNFLAHKSEMELSKTLTAIPLSTLTSIKCKASYQLKLLLCATLSPSCINVALPPCSRLCLITKSSCEPALRRQGFEWPDFLECKRFPRGPDYCLEGQPSMYSTDASTGLTTLHKPKMDSSNHTSGSAAPRRRKTRPNKYKARPNQQTTTTTTTTTQQPLTEIYPSNETISSQFDERNTVVEELQLSTTTETSVSTHNIDKKTTISPVAQTTLVKIPSEDATATTTAAKYDTGTRQSNFSGVETVQTHYSSMSVNTTEDLTQLICSISPDWLIKTKLSDSQLMSAAIKRKLKVRSYLQVFGLTNRDSSTNLTTLRSNKSISTNLYLSVSNTTLFVSPMGPHIYTQPLSDTLLKASESSTEPKSVRHYLVAGKGSNGTLKSANLFILWPGASRFSTIDPDSQGSLNIIKTYREFKRRTTKVCERQAASSSAVSVPRQMASTQELDSTDSSQQAANQQANKPPRKHKRKRVHSTSD